MIWLTWRQHRGAALFTLIGLLALAAALVPTGLEMRATFTELGMPDCLSARQHDKSPDGCEQAMMQFTNEYGAMGMSGILLIFLPLLVGLFWGAPLMAREVERGTHRLAWTQGVSRRRWALVKFGFVGGVGILVSVAYGLIVSWWMSPLDQAGLYPRFIAPFFDIQGIAPIGYTLFAIALGVLAGTVVRKTIPAMAIGIAGFIAVRIPMLLAARPSYLPPKTHTYPVENADRVSHGTTRNDWVLTSNVHDADGDIVSTGSAMGCEAGASGCGDGRYNAVIYQPEERFWTFQGIETGIFLALAVVLLYFAVRRIRRIA